MEKYEKPSMEVVGLKNDVILTSGCSFDFDLCDNELPPL